MVVKYRKKPWDIRLEAILLALYCALIPLENVLAASIGGSFNRYIGIVIIAVIILRNARRRYLNVTDYETIGLFCLLAILSFAWSIGAGNSYLSILINMTVCTLVFIQFPLNQKEVALIHNAIVLAGVILALIMLTGGRATTINTISGGRMTLVFGGLMIDNNNLAVSISIPAIIAFSKLYEKRNNVFRAAFLISFFLITIAIFYTGSRGGLIAEIAGLAILIWKSGKGVRLRNIIIGAVAIIAFAVIVQNFLTAGLVARFSIQDVIASGGTGRTRIWRDALEGYSRSSIFRQMFGYGFGAFGSALRSFSGYSTASHNDFIGILVELGIVGIVIYIVLWVKLFKKTVVDKNWLVLSLLVVILVGSLSMEMIIKKMLWLVRYMALFRVNDDVEYTSTTV